jgi:hypothetical protein
LTHTVTARAQEDEAWEVERQAMKRARHENRYLAALSRTGLELPETQTDALKAALRDLTDREWPKPAVAELIEAELKQHKAAAKRSTPSKGKAKAAHTELREAFANLELRKLEKIVPERAYSLAVHPTPLKDLVFVGDKIGHLGIWDALAPDEEEDLDEDEVGASEKPKTSWSVRAHTKGTISALRFSPTDGHTVCALQSACERSLDRRAHRSSPRPMTRHCGPSTSRPAIVSWSSTPTRSPPKTRAKARRCSLASTSPGTATSSG